MAQLKRAQEEAAKLRAKHEVKLKEAQAASEQKMAELQAELDDAQAKIDSGSEEVKERCVGKNKLSKPAGPTVQSVYPDGSYAIVIGINDYTSSGVPKDEGGMGNLDSARQARHRGIPKRHTRDHLRRRLHTARQDAQQNGP